jgi:four helix bundle protein
MRYQRFEELSVWNDAIGLALRVLRLSQDGHLSGEGDLKNQIERAAISISNNIAEGFERGTDQELVSFLYIAKGSSAEVRSMLHPLASLPKMDGLAPQVEELLGRAENVSRHLGRWIESLKDSPYQGKRYQNTQTRQTAEAARRRDRFLDKVREIKDAAIRGQAPSVDGEGGSPRPDERGDRTSPHARVDPDDLGRPRSV